MDKKKFEDTANEEHRFHHNNSPILKNNTDIIK